MAATAAAAFTFLIATTVLAILFAWHAFVAADREAANAQSLRGEQAKTNAAFQQSRLQSARFALEKGQAQLAAVGRGDGVPDAVTGMLWMAQALELTPEDAGELRKRAIRINLALWSRRTILAAAGRYLLRAVFGATSSQGLFFVTSSEKSGRIWDLKTGQAVGKPLVQEDSIRVVACSADGTRALTAGWTGKMCVWDLPTGEPRGLVIEHPDRVTSAALNPDGQAAATIGKDGTLRLWDLTTGQLRCPPVKQKLLLEKLSSWSPDGQRRC